MVYHALISVLISNEGLEMFPALFDLVRDHARDGSKFPYAFLGPSQIRLLKILPGQKGDKLLCELVHTALDKAPSYDALSYAYNPQSQHDNSLNHH